MTISNKKLAVIHILKKELELSDREYRDTLGKITGVRSAKDLTDETFQVLMRYFVRSKYYKLNAQGLTIKQRLYIENEFKHLSWDETHIKNFLRKYYKKDQILDLNKKEASKVIIALKKILKNQPRV